MRSMYKRVDIDMQTVHHTEESAKIIRKWANDSTVHTRLCQNILYPVRAVRARANRGQGMAFLKSRNESQRLGRASIEDSTGMGVIVIALVINEADDQVVNDCHYPPHVFVRHTGLIFLKGNSRR